MYEGKMIWQFNHRASSIDYKGRIVPGRHDVIETDEYQLIDPNFSPIPRFWVYDKEINNRIKNNVKYLFGFRDITNASSERTSIFSFIPLTGVGHQMPLIFTEKKEPMVKAILATIFNSFVFDFISRQKLGGTHMTYFILKQLPVVLFESIDILYIDKIIDIVLKLSYTASDIVYFAHDLGYNGPPFRWDPEERAYLMAELDAIVAHLYGVTHDELDYILETFPIVKKKDIAKYGEYRTKRLIFEYYNNYKDLLEATQ
ncbi:MAG: restriction endonuclease [Candidatus Methanogaster sp.]|uniref:Restriction endonuclease n=1 Tax=Candidatus Methanogaster sp. TaxID=3386292 RepID=A0AC61L563_9EURY|nr:MAG: restriction endonuclease [ANME-2 cluster archaeon]